MDWPVSGVRLLEPGAAPWQIDLAAILGSRRSCRRFSPLSLQAVGSLLWQSCRALAVSESPYGFELEQRPVPSAGAIHPIHILLQLPDTNEWARYNARAHRLDLLLDSKSYVLQGLVARAIDLAELGQGSVMAFVAEPGLTAAKYNNPESLLWRDAGVLQGTLALVAHALSIQFCLLGITGEPWVGMLANEGELRGMGLAVLGGGARRPLRSLGISEQKAPHDFLDGSP